MLKALKSIGARPDRIQRLKRWQVILFGDDRSLIHVLVADEEEQTIFDSGSADPHAGILAGEERIRVERAALQAGVSRHVVVPVIVISAAVEIVASRASNYVDASGRSDSCGRIEI